MRPGEELYDLKSDRHCTKNIVTDSDQLSLSKLLLSQMEEELKLQNDPRMFGNGKLFDEYPATNGAGFYDKYLNGEKPKAGWISPTDIEKDPFQ